MDEQVIKIVPHFDLTIKLIEKTTTISNNEVITTETLLATFLVSRDVLMKNSPHFSNMLHGHFRETNECTVTLEDGTRTSMELWFRLLHNIMTDDMYEIEIPEIWEALHVCGYRELNIDMLKPWFHAWLERKGLENIYEDDMEKLMFPCHELDHAEGFAYITKFKAYESAEHIHEMNPTTHGELHLQHNVLGSVNGARGSLRSRLLRGLFQPLALFTTRRCRCRGDSLLAYVTALTKTGIWPLDSVWRKSIREILSNESLQSFAPVVPANACVYCESRLKSECVKGVVEAVDEEFHGLCLDCMDGSKKDRDVDMEYWEHDQLEEWGRGCRVKHGQPSWYFSYMGRKTEMKSHQKEMKRKRKGL